MKKTCSGALQTITLALSALVLVTTAGCEKLMDNSLDNPHRPVISNLVVYPTTVTRGGQVWFTFDYYDAGADIVNVYVRDNESGKRWEGVPPEDAPEDYVLFPGTHGRIGFIIDGLDVAQAGPHTLVFWLEDEEEGVSERVSFTVNVVI